MPCPCVRRVCRRTLESVFKTRSGMNRRAGRAIVLPVHRLEAATTPLLYDEGGGGTPTVGGMEGSKKGCTFTPEKCVSRMFTAQFFQHVLKCLYLGFQALARDCRDPSCDPR